MTGIKATFCTIGWLVICGCAVAPTPTRIFEVSLSKAKAGDAAAQERVAYLYMTGRGVGRNPELARDWYLASAELGNVSAKAALGELGIELSNEAPLATGEQGGASETGPKGVSPEAHHWANAHPVGSVSSLSEAALQESHRLDPSAVRLPPRILVSDHFSTSKNILLILGQVQAESAIREVVVGGKRAQVEPDGRFGIRLKVPIGEIRVEISATDVRGISARTLVSISRFDYPDVRPNAAGFDIEFGRFHALLIGNNEYSQLQSLTTAVADVDAIARLLSEDYGYEVQALYDATRSEIRFALSSYRETLSDSDNLLIYYAGHGTMDEKADEAYWLPVDASLGIDTNWISNATLSTTLRAIEARHVIVVADSCYSGTLVRGPGVGGRVERYLDRELRELRFRRMNNGHSRTALTSGASEPVVDVGRGGHSVFANALIGALEANAQVLTATDLYVEVRRSVMLKADQSPQYGDIRMTGHEDGDYLFVRLKREHASDAVVSTSAEDYGISQ